MLRSVWCSNCNKEFFRSIGRYNEAVKFDWKQYCSKKCQRLGKKTSVVVRCANLECDKEIIRQKNQFLRFGKAYCSHRCFAIDSNKKHPRWLWKIKKCTYCGKDFRRNKKYCSPECQYKSQMLSKDFLLNQIKDFVAKEKRVPFKREVGHYSATRRGFGSWNNAIKLAGFSPNPILFARKYIAKDGHKCDSLSEKIIDDWLYERRIKHIRNSLYPGKVRFTADFKIGDYIVEFFGLAGVLKTYDNQINRKLKTAKAFNLKLIEIYPIDLFPLNRIERKLGFLR